GSFFFSHSAYGASYLNVSSSAPEGLVKFSKVQPSSSGEMSTAQDTLTVNTNCTVGYSVYVSAINGGDTNLTNDSASGNNTISASSATVGGTSTVLSPNTWGINANSSDVSENKYFGLPSYSSATTTALTTKANVETSSTVPIYYGAKVTTAIAPGTYNGDVLYTVISNPSCSVYTIVFNANGGTGEMNNQAITVGVATNLHANEFERTGYNFLGWSTSSNGKTGNAVDGIGTAADVDYANEASVTDISDFNTTLNLYAIWEVAADGEMQTWTGCSSLSTGQIVKLKDTRDDTIYKVKKLPDGKCWMIENLTISATGLQVSQFDNTNTNIPNTDSNYYYLPPRNASYEAANSINNSAVLSASASVDFSPGKNYPQVAYQAAGTTTPNQNNSNPVPENTAWYNFYTATLGFSYYNDNISSGSSPRDICPKGWRLPWASNGGTNSYQGSADFYRLALSYNSNPSVWTNYIAPDSSSSNRPSTVDTTIRNNMVSGDANSIDRFGNNGAVGFTYAGVYSGTTLYNIGTSGYYRSSSVNGTSNGYSLIFILTDIYPQRGDSHKDNGQAVRCVAQNNYTVSYNANGGTGAASKESDSIYETGEVTTAGQGTLAKEGYNFLGWSLDANAMTATYNAGTAVSVPSLISAAGSPASGSTITLYAVWEKEKVYMQSFNCNTLSPSGETATLVDSRDNQEYTVYRIPTDNQAINVAGKCIMTKDLNLGAVNSAPGSSSSFTAHQALTLSAEDSTFTRTDGTDYESPAITYPTTTATVNNITISGRSDANSYTNKQYIASGTGYYTGRGYYSWGAAMVACPKGWRLPTTEELNNSDSWSASTSGIAYAAGNSLATLQQSPWLFMIGGGYFSDLGDGDVNGFYWSSTQFDDSIRSYGLGLRPSSGIYRPQAYKRYGFAVRCIADGWDGTMQDFDASTSLSNTGDTAVLKDVRDGTLYNVKRLADGKVWMTENLILGHDKGYALTNEYTNIQSTDTATYYLPQAGYTGALNSASTTGSATFDTSTRLNQAHVQYRAQGSSGDQNSSGTLGQSTGYYNFYAATLGCSYYDDGLSIGQCASGYIQKDICPKGWHLPTGGPSGQFVALDIAMNGGTGNNREDTTARDRFLNQASFLYSGRYNNSQLYNIGLSGYWWSSTVSSTNNGYLLHLGSNSGINPQGSGNKRTGLAVRCMAN
ncbi:InlB B-repeat-containing protein, partial [Candidatus Saccharibacteria bacterium]|nr:InlB B-repeat-containing protein [Candidatus Saccharibacteria bacterium]